MSTDIFVKGECGHCAGHLEFPAAAAGETIECPHCGQSTKLAARRLLDKSRLWRGLFITAIIAIVLAAVFAVTLGKRHKKIPILPATAKTNLVAAPIIATHPTDEIITNEFSISGIRLEKTTNSSLVYVTGKVRNLTDRQRFGVKLECSLFDANQLAAGTATDYQRLLNPHEEWVFQALVINSKAASARLLTIAETQ